MREREEVKHARNTEDSNQTLVWTTVCVCLFRVRSSSGQCCACMCAVQQCFLHPVLRVTEMALPRQHSRKKRPFHGGFTPRFHEMQSRDLELEDPVGEFVALHQALRERVSTQDPMFLFFRVQMCWCSQYGARLVGWYAVLVANSLEPLTSPGVESNHTKSRHLPGPEYLPFKRSLLSWCFSHLSVSDLTLLVMKPRRTGAPLVTASTNYLRALPQTTSAAP